MRERKNKIRTGNNQNKVLKNHSLIKSEGKLKWYLVTVGRIDLQKWDNVRLDAGMKNVLGREEVGGVKENQIWWGDSYGLASTSHLSWHFKLEFLAGIRC